MELGWIAVRPVRNRLLLGSFIILPLRLGISKYKYLVFQFIFTGFVHWWMSHKNVPQLLLKMVRVCQICSCFPLCSC